MPDSKEWVPRHVVFAAKEPRPAQQAFYIAKEQVQPPAPERKVYESTFFNMAAAGFIHYNQLDAPATTDQLRKLNVREIEFPTGSKALKTFWYLINSNEKVDVRLWDWRAITTGFDQLPRDLLKTVCVEKEPATDSHCLKAVDNFYTVTVDDPNAFFCEKCPKLAKGDLLILIAMHIASKQTPEWLWATYWWRGPDKSETQGMYWTCTDAQRPDSIGHAGPPWSNYSMDVTQSFKLAKPLPKSASDKACGVPGEIGHEEQYLAAYNPFVEAFFRRGLKSNCVVCHSSASTNILRDKMTFVAPVNSPQPTPLLRDFEAHIRLDYMWSVRSGLKLTAFHPTGP